MRVVIVGATGLVGKTFLTLLEERNFPVDQLFLLASDRSLGQTLLFRGQAYPVAMLQDFDWKKARIDVAFFGASNDISWHYAPLARDAGALVIDNSSAFRYEADIPLIVPEVNGYCLDLHLKSQLIANPNCSTIQLMLALAPLQKKFKLKRVIVSTYQAVSGAGQGLWHELLQEASSSQSIHANLIPQIDVMESNGYSREEMKIVWESRKILNQADLLISATAVRVPVENAHSESVVVETLEPASVIEAMNCLSHQHGLVLLREGWITPKEVSGRNEVFVGRVRRDLVFAEKGLAFWIVADNLRKGAALNAIQIAELFLA